MDISVEKFIKGYKRMCDSHDNCRMCPLFDTKVCDFWDSDTIEMLGKIVPVVQEWVETHPAKTYLMDFREKFPKANKDITWGCCCRAIYEDEACSYSNCDECWNREMEE